MAAWTRTEDENFITFTREDGLAGRKIAKHTHCHAEQWMPWSEAPDNYSSQDATGMAQYHEDELEAQGHTVVAGGLMALTRWITCPACGNPSPSTRGRIQVCTDCGTVGWYDAARPADYPPDFDPGSHSLDSSKPEV